MIGNSYEVVSADLTQIDNPNVQELGKLSTKDTRKREYITYQQALENFKNQMLDPPLESKNKGYFLDPDDAEAKKFINQVQEEINKCVVNGTIEKIELRGRATNAFALRVQLKDGKGEFRADQFFASKFCEESQPKITAVTLYTTPEEIRGLRVSLDDNKVRLYEIIKGSYNIKFNWKVGDKDCSITLNVSDNGTITHSNSSQGLTCGDLEENKDVKIKIGNGKEMTLKEAVLLTQSQAKSSGEEVSAEPLTNLANPGASQVATKQLANA